MVTATLDLFLMLKKNLTQKMHLLRLFFECVISWPSQSVKVLRVCKQLSYVIFSLLIMYLMAKQCKFGWPALFERALPYFAVFSCCCLRWSQALGSLAKGRNLYKRKMLSISSLNGSNIRFIEIWNSLFVI